jgi:hypothetical protein
LCEIGSDKYCNKVSLKRKMVCMANFFPVGRERGITVVFDGFFACVWFGWGQAAAPPWLVAPLAVGTVLSVLVAVVGVVVTTRSTGRLAVVSNPAVRRGYRITVGVEFTLAGVGAVALGTTGLAQWIPVWICLVVGVHFFPLARILENRSLVPLGALLTAIAAAALVVGLTSTVAPSTIAGPGTGLCLLAFGLATLLAYSHLHLPRRRQVA